MRGRNPNFEMLPRPVAVEEVLESHYEQLLKWAHLLTRGETVTAQEIVHDLCLYLSLTKPDFSYIVNLDGYLYTSLRHTYLSRLERSAREAMHIVSVEDYDSVHFAFAALPAHIPLDTQNDLRRICGYAVWRKDSSKSFSYFVLHFFHGYFPREIAKIACLPIAAIYNKLKAARTELKANLSGSKVIHMAQRDTPPPPKQSHSVVSSPDLFRELRESVLRARRMECLPEDELLSHYRVTPSQPIPAALLSHIVSCERCLGLIDRHFRQPTLRDRDALDGFDRGLNMKSMADEASATRDSASMFSSMQRRRERIYEHRPETLSIAVNGRIVAFHDVHGEQCTLTARIEDHHAAQFVEVFSRQNIRLALLSVGEPPPTGLHTVRHRTDLSDGRWMDLILLFDGLGLETQVIYSDPALTTLVEEDVAEVRHSVAASPIENHPSVVATSEAQLPGLMARFFSLFKSSPKLGWAFILASLAFTTVAYVVSRYFETQNNGEAILNRAVSLETAQLHGNVEHQVMQVAETLKDGHILVGTVDLWQDGDGSRSMRRLYDDQHHLVAAAWRGKDGTSGLSVMQSGAPTSDDDRLLASNDLWKQDVSTRAFHSVSRRELRAKKTDVGYELSSTFSNENQQHLISATIVLDHHLNTEREVLRFQDGFGVKEVRYVQSVRDLHAASSVPDTVFAPTMSEKHSAGGFEAHSPERSTDHLGAGNSRFAELEIGVLYQLHRAGMDVGEPVEVSKTVDGHLRVYGTMSDDRRKAAIISELAKLSNQPLLQIELMSPKDSQTPDRSIIRSKSPLTSIYSVVQQPPPAYPVLMKYFLADGLKNDQAELSTIQFSNEALGHAQHALQRAYALSRLGRDFTSDDLRWVDPTAKKEWAEMVADHVSALKLELSQLQGQLQRISPSESPDVFPSADGPAIRTPADFAREAERMLHATQNLSSKAESAFTSGPATKANDDPLALFEGMEKSIPAQEVSAMANFATSLARSADSMSRAGNSQVRPLRDDAR